MTSMATIICCAASFTGTKAISTGDRRCQPEDRARSEGDPRLFDARRPLPAEKDYDKAIAEYSEVIKIEPRRQGLCRPRLDLRAQERPRQSGCGFRHGARCCRTTMPRRWSAAAWSRAARASPPTAPPISRSPRGLNPESSTRSAGSGWVAVATRRSGSGYLADVLEAKGHESRRGRSNVGRLPFARVVGRLR